MKLQRVNTTDGNLYGYQFTCPGCSRIHLLPVGMGTGHMYPHWRFNDDLEAPTFEPSIQARWDSGPGSHMNICHSFVRNGNIQFMDDCTHSLRGQTVALMDFGEFEK